MALSLVRAAFAAFAMLVGVAAASAQEQPAENIPLENSDAIARKLFYELSEKVLGAKTAPQWAYEVDFNLDGFSEIYGYVDQPNCDGVKCGLFLFLLDGDNYREIFGDLPEARLTAPNSVFLGNFKRNGFIDLQLGQLLASWNGKTYADATTFPASTLDGARYIEVCMKSFGDQPEGGLEQATATCQCRLDRMQALDFTQEKLDSYTTYLADYVDPANGGTEWADTLQSAQDTETGCEIAAGRKKWEPAYFKHGEQAQSRVEFDAFIDACDKQDFILSHRNVGTPERALGICGCLARELPMYGAGQDGFDLLTRYYDGELSDADLDTEQPDLLGWHDTAAEACLSQFPKK